MEPPGGTFRCEILHGFTFRPEEEIESIIKDTSLKYQGTSYNLLGNNCNHFTSYLCERLTSRPAPAWVNRAASIGVALPCVVPRDWVAPPDHDTADGELVVDDEEDESAAMLHQITRRAHDFHASSGDGDGPDWHDEDHYGEDNRALKDTDGRVLPASERARSSTTL